MSNINCKECGACCKYDWVIEVSQIESNLIPKEYLYFYGVIIMKYDKTINACSAWDPITKLCKIYDVRPEACRKVQIDDQWCKTAIERLHIVRQP